MHRTVRYDVLDVSREYRHVSFIETNQNRESSTTLGRKLATQPASQRDQNASRLAENYNASIDSCRPFFERCPYIMFCPFCDCSYRDVVDLPHIHREHARCCRSVSEADPHMAGCVGLLGQADSGQSPEKEWNTGEGDRVASCLRGVMAQTRKSRVDGRLPFLDKVEAPTGNSQHCKFCKK